MASAIERSDAADDADIDGSDQEDGDVAGAKRRRSSSMAGTLRGVASCVEDTASLDDISTLGGPGLLARPGVVYAPVPLWAFVMGPAGLARPPPLDAPYASALFCCSWRPERPCAVVPLHVRAEPLLRALEGHVQQARARALRLVAGGGRPARAGGPPAPMGAP